MQEKGRRLAQELPGFNWLEEKIRNGGMTTVLPPRRVSGGPVVDPPNKITPSSETRSVVSHRVSNSASDAARTSVPPTPSSPPEQRLVVIVYKYRTWPQDDLHMVFDDARCGLNSACAAQSQKTDICEQCGGYCLRFVGFIV